MPYRSRGPRCPRCARPLLELAIDEGAALGCEGCGGVLIDDAGFAFVRARLYAAILERTGMPPPVASDDQSPPLACPACGSAMQRTRLASAPIDFCAEHGSWFDAHELAAVAQAIADERGIASVKRASDDDSLPWSRSRETAEKLAVLHAELKHQTDCFALTELVRQLRRAGVGL